MQRKDDVRNDLNTKQRAIEPKRHENYILLDIIDRGLSIFTSLAVFCGAQRKQMTSEDI